MRTLSRPVVTAYLSAMVQGQGGMFSGAAAVSPGVPFNKLGGAAGKGVVVDNRPGRQTVMNLAHHVARAAARYLHVLPSARITSSLGSTDRSCDSGSPRSPFLSVRKAFGGVVRDTIFIIDQLDEERRRIAAVLASGAADVRTFASAEDFLQAITSDAAGCIVAPCDLGGMGLSALIEAIRGRRQTLPVVVVGRDDDVAKAVKLIRAGAAEFLEPPISDRRLRAAVDRTIRPIRR